MAGARIDDYRTFTQAIGESDFDLARHEQRGLQRRFSGQPLGDQPDAGTQEAEDNHDGAAKDRHLLLPQTHFRLG